MREVIDAAEALDRLGTESRGHFEGCSAAHGAGIAFDVDPRLVRGSTTTIAPSSMGHRPPGRAGHRGRRGRYDASSSSSAARRRRVRIRMGIEA